MAKFCSEHCEETGAICDFCKFYDFNGDEEGAYTGDGHCNKFDVQKDPEDGLGCEEFICFKAEGEDKDE